MDQSSGAVIATLVLSIGAMPLLVLIHEFGHAAAVWLRRLPLKELQVGDTADLVIRTPGIRLQFGRHLGQGDVAGYISYDGEQATPVDVLVISLAGPAANLIAGGAGVLVGVYGSFGGLFELVWWLVTASSFALAIGNLVPSGTDDPDSFSDGRWAELAWRVLRDADDRVARSPRRDLGSTASSGLALPGQQARMDEL
jgi:hypothetical protein